MKKKTKCKHEWRLLGEIQVKEIFVRTQPEDPYGGEHVWGVSYDPITGRPINLSEKYLSKPESSPLSTNSKFFCIHCLEMKEVVKIGGKGK